MVSEPHIFSGSASKELATQICDYLNLPLGNSETSSFSDRETRVKINENVRGTDVFIIQSTYTPANDNLMELLLLIDAAKRASAERVNAVIPYFGYARQDRKDQGRVALSAKLVANLIDTAGADRVLTIDLHSSQIQGFFDIPVDHLYAAPILVKYVKELTKDNGVVVAPDVGGVKLARVYAERLCMPLAIVDKRRPEPNVSEVMNIIGDVEGKDAFLIDDLVDTAGTLINAAAALKDRKARDVYACCTHGVFSGDALERIERSRITRMIVTNTIPLREDKAGKIEIASVAAFIGEAIHRIHRHQSVSALFTYQNEERKASA